MILLDTHVLVWIAFGDRRLGSVARATVDGDADRRVSAMLSWEVAMLVDKRQLELDLPLDLWLAEGARTLGLREVPVSGAIALDAGSLPGGIHGDPCDRIMIATARALNCPLVTADRKILDYAAAGHLQALDARR